MAKTLNFKKLLIIGLVAASVMSVYFFLGFQNVYALTVGENKGYCYSSDGDNPYSAGYIMTWLCQQAGGCAVEEGSMPNNGQGGLIYSGVATDQSGGISSSQPQYGPYHAPTGQTYGVTERDCKNVIGAGNFSNAVDS